MYRVTLRFSFNDDTNSAVRNTLEPILRAQGHGLQGTGFANISTGTWQSTNMSLFSASLILSQLFDVLHDPVHLANAGPKFAVDHLWLYIEKA